MENLPVYIHVVFVLTTFLTVIFFYYAAHKSAVTLGILVVWLALQSIIGISGFYQVTDSMPPRFLLLIGPPLLLIAGLFLTTKGKLYLDNLELRTLTILHLVRIPVEIVLFWLFIHKGIPELMTFEGRNFDILSGLTAPFVYYFGFIKMQLPAKFIIAWNILCLGLLINIVSIAVLAAPSPFQKLALDQPNTVVLYFPFVWLPACIVPVVLLSHLASLRQLLKSFR